MVVSSDSEYNYHYADKHYYFFSKHCLQKFKEHPEQYLDKETSQSHETHDELITYTCPMHPEIQQQGPGNCPKCGMQMVQWIEFGLATPVVLWGGWPFFIRGWRSVQTWNLNMFTLIALGVSVAWVYSVVGLFSPQIFPPVMQMKDGLVDVYFEAAAVITALVGIAMGTGTDVAIESAGITLVKGDLRGIVRARRLSRSTMRNIRQNLFFVFIYNTIGVPVAAGVLYPFFGLLLSPIIAEAATSFSSVSVISNSLRLRRVKL